MGQAGKRTRHNRTITVDFQNEAPYFQLLGDGKAFVECVMAFLLSLGFQLAHKATCHGGGCLTRHSHYVRVRLGGLTIWRIQCTTCRAVFTVLPHFVLRYRSMHPWPVRAAARVRPSVASALRSMADLARLPSQDGDPAMVLSRAYALRLKIYQEFGTVQQLVAETTFEPGAAAREVMLQLLAEAQAAFLVLLALVQDSSDAALRGGPVMAREAANRCDAAVAESFEALAAGLEGQQRRPWPDLAGALAALERGTAAHLHDSTAAA